MSDEIICDLFIHGRIHTTEAWKELCTAVAADFKTEFETRDVHKIMKWHIETGETRAHIECNDLRSSADKIRECAVKHGLNVIVRIGSDWNSGGTTFYVKDGIPSRTIPYMDQDAKPVFSLENILGSLSRRETIGDLARELERFQGFDFPALSADPSVYEAADMDLPQALEATL